jgi:hypothetical protein
MSVIGVNVIQDDKLTTTRTRWVRVRRSWRERMLGGRVNFTRVFTGAVALIFAQQVPMPIPAFMLAMVAGGILVCVHPSRVGISHKPVKISEQIPDPNCYMVSGTMIVHPATWGVILAKLETMGVATYDYGMSIWEGVEKGLEK